MNASDRFHDDLIDHLLLLQRYKSTLGGEVSEFISKLESELLSLTWESNLTEVARRYQQARMEKLIGKAREAINANLIGAAKEHVSGALAELARIESAFVHTLAEGVIGIDLFTTSLSPEQVRAIASKVMIEGAPSKEWWSRQAKQLQNAFTDQVRLGMIRGEGMADIIRRIRGTKAANFSDGIMSAVWRNADALVRTSVQTVANNARLETYAANQDVLKGLQWTATLDTRTSKICMGLHGKVWLYQKDGSLKPSGHNVEFPGPTAHWNCRSTQVPVVKSFGQLDTFGAIPLPGGRTTQIETLWRKIAKQQGFTDDQLKRSMFMGRSSMDGEVAADMSFDDWLKRKGAAAQDRLLGKGAAELFRKGKITLSDLIDQRARPLTLAELEKLSNAKR